MSRGSTFVLASLLALLVWSAAPTEAEAQGYFGVGVGPALRIDDWPNQVHIEAELGYYFSGRANGFFIAFAPTQSWGQDFWVLRFPFRLGGMINIVRQRDFTFQLGPTGTIGFAASDHFDNGRDPDPWFHLSIAFMLRFLVANERIAFYIKPAELEFAIGDTGGGWYGNEAVRYILTGGAQFYF